MERSTSRTRTRTAPPTPWLALLVVSLALRLACAWAFAAGGTASLTEALAIDRSASGQGDDASVAPVVPWLTGLVYGVTGHSTAGALALQCVLGTLVPLLLVAIGSRLYGSPVGWRAGWIAAFDPLLLLSSTALLVEAPFTTLQLLALLATIEWVRTPRRGRAMGAGLLWGLAALTHPLALWMPLGIAAWAWGPLGLTLIPRERLLQIALLALALVLTLMPWSIRSSIRLARPVLVTASSAAGAEDTAPGGAGGRLARFALEGASLERWQTVHSTRLRVPGALDPLRIWGWLTLPLAVWGLARTARGPRRWFQSVVPIGILATAIVVMASPEAIRLRAPIEPLMILLAAAGLDDLLRRTGVRGRGLTLVESPARGETEDATGSADRSRWTPRP